jgi:uncharacterized protein (TIGR02147 family)
MSLFEFDDYKLFVNSRLAELPSKGRGEFQRIARALSVHPTLVSHIFRGEKDLTLEQATSLSHHFGLTTMETDYFLLLVTYSRAGSKALKQVLERQIQSQKKQSRELVNRVIADKTLGEQDKAIFYSNWYFSAIRLLTSIPGIDSREAIRARLGLPLETIDRVLEFLAKTGLCRFDGTRYSLGPALTHLESGSDFISKHHLNWRLKAIERHSYLSDRDMAFSAPLSISRKDADGFRERLVELIQRLGESAKGSDPEELRCFNIDWVKIA